MDSDSRPPGGLPGARGFAAGLEGQNGAVGERGAGGDPLAQGGDFPGSDGVAGGGHGAGLVVGEGDDLEESAGFGPAGDDPGAAQTVEGGGVAEGGHVREAVGAVAVDAVALEGAAGGGEGGGAGSAGAGAAAGQSEEGEEGKGEAGESG